ncbi:universal stress protein [Nonomuraea basaltis]|nr:universal stress protein [Nonomuraea basaltis]
MMNRAIVVGVDGSQAAKSALTWAAEDAARRSLPLRIVHVREPWTAEHPLIASSAKEALTERDNLLLASAAEQARALASGTRISTALITGAVTERLRSESETADTVVEMVESVVGGHPVPALAEASRVADLVVVGSRGLGGFTSAARRLFADVRHWGGRHQERRWETRLRVRAGARGRARPARAVEGARRATGGRQSSGRLPGSRRDPDHRTRRPAGERHHGSLGQSRQGRLSPASVRHRMRGRDRLRRVHSACTDTGWLVAGNGALARRRVHPLHP